MQRYKYRAVNQKGRPVRGVVSAASEVDLANQLQTAGLELIKCAPISTQRSKISNFKFKNPVKIRDMIQFYTNMGQMQGAGVPLLNALNDIRDSSDNAAMRDILAEICRDVSEGSSLSEAMSRHPRVFSSLQRSLVASAEETGNMMGAYEQLVSYMKWVDDMQTKVKKATRYPMILLFVIVVTISVMMGFVVPQVVGFIENSDQELPVYTLALMKTSDFFQEFWWAVLLGPIVLVALIILLRKMSYDIAYRLDYFALQLPILGQVSRKINIARFAQTFGSLFSSGIDVLSSMEAARQTVTNLVIRESLEQVQENVKAGRALSDAFQGEFPSMVVRMVRVGEESGNLTEVLEQVSEFYAKDVDEAVEGMVSMIEPLLTMILGIMILWIAVAVFGPIYESFENINL